MGKAFKLFLKVPVVVAAGSFVYLSPQLVERGLFKLAFRGDFCHCVRIVPIVIKYLLIHLVLFC